MDLKKIGNFIAERRKLKNLTQEQLGRCLGVDRRTISKWETGVYAPDISLLEPLSKQLNISINDVLSGEILTKENDSTIIDSIKFYNKSFKSKIIFSFCTLFIIIITVFILFIVYKSKSEYKVYNLKSTNDIFEVSGILIYNSFDAIFSINKIKYNDVYVGTDKEIMGRDITVSLYVNDEFIEKSGMDGNKNTTINDLLENINFLYQNQRKSRESINIKLTLDYNDNNNEVKTLELPLIMY